MAGGTFWNHLFFCRGCLPCSSIFPRKKKKQLYHTIIIKSTINKTQHIFFHLSHSPKLKSYFFRLNRPELWTVTNCWGVALWDVSVLIWTSSNIAPQKTPDNKIPTHTFFVLVLQPIECLFFPFVLWIKMDFP